MIWWDYLVVFFWGMALGIVLAAWWRELRDGRYKPKMKELEWRGYDHEDSNDVWGAE